MLIQKPNRKHQACQAKLTAKQEYNLLSPSAFPPTPSLITRSAIGLSTAARLVALSAGLCLDGALGAPRLLEVLFCVGKTLSSSSIVTEPTILQITGRNRSNRVNIRRTDQQLSHHTPCSATRVHQANECEDYSLIREVDGNPLDSNRWGAKASGLSALVKAGMPIPPALCFLPEALDQKGGDKLLEWWLLSNPAKLYVLRSSSAFEDLSCTAGAGVSKTLIDLPGDATYLQTLVNNRLAPALSGGSLILQVQAECLYAGVAFVEDETVTVEASLRSITAVTSGVPPDLSVVSRADSLGLRIEESQLNFPLLSIVRQIVAFSRRAAEIYGGCADIEWVHTGQACLLIQARPLTRRLRDQYGH